MHATVARALYQAALSLVGLHLARRNAHHANAGLGPAHPRYGDAAALLGGGLAHAEDARGVRRRWSDYVVEERCGTSFGELRKGWRVGRELARLGRRDPGAALASMDGGSKGAANRGLCFFTTRCGHYLVKQESAACLRQLERNGVAQRYAARAAQRGSLLPRLVGAYTVRSNASETHWLVMAHTFAGAPPVSAVYDVKGSTAGRRTRPKKGTLKDLDARDDAATLACRRSADVVKALAADTRVLEQLRLLDYSLLIGVCEPRWWDRWRAFRYRRRALNRGVRALPCVDRGFVVVGLIDVFQPWTWAKVCEYYARGALYGWRRISAVPPAVYRRRFLAFVATLLDGPAS